MTEEQGTYLTKVQSELAVFGGRDAIRDMADRLTKMIPGAVRFTAQEALTVAQVAIAHGLDPFNGEVWGLKSESGKWYGTMVGIKGLRKLARQQSNEEGGTYWTEPPTRVDPKTYNQAETAVVYEVKLRDSATMQAYSKSLHALTSAGVPYKDAIDMLGKAPVWVGVGIATPNEMSKLGIHARARKRAEADAIKQRYDVRFQGATIEVDNEPDDTVNVVDSIAFDVTPEPEQPEEQPKRDPQAIMMELGYEPKQKST